MSESTNEAGRVGTRPWSELIHELFDWANRLYRAPPSPLTQEDAVYLSGMVFALVLPAKHGNTGGIKNDTWITCLCFAVLSMAGIRPGRPLPPRATGVWRGFGRWLREIFDGGDPAKAARTEAVHATISTFIEESLAGVLWLGDPVLGYAQAAKQCNRGGWKAVLEKAERDAVLSGDPTAVDDELRAMFEAGALGADGAFYRKSDGTVLPNFGGNLDLFLKDVPLPTTADPVAPDTAAADGLRHLDAVNRDRLLRRVRKRVEAMPRRSKNSRYSALVSANAWRLPTEETNPEQLASELGVSPRPLRREWARHKERLRRDEHIAALLRELRDSA